MIKYVHVDIYRCSVVFFFEEDIKRIVKSLGRDNVSKEFENELIGLLEDKSLGSCSRLNNDGVDIVVLIKKFPEKSSEYGVLYHEIHHACRFICKDRGVEDFEAEAYLFEYIVNEINGLLWSMKA